MNRPFANAYVSQIERGLIKQPDPIVLLELSELHGLNFRTLAAWALRVSDVSRTRPTPHRRLDVGPCSSNHATRRQPTPTVLRYVDAILREHRT